jgi:diguanylate cyclase (GGDEF)-like protein
MAIDRACHFNLVTSKSGFLSPSYDPQIPFLIIGRAVVFANSSVLTQSRRFDSSEFDGLPNPVWVFDIQTRQILWANRTALDLGNPDCREALVLPEWSALGWLDVLGFWQDLKPRGLSESGIVAWQLETPHCRASKICLCSGVRMEDGRHALLMQVPTEKDCKMLVEKLMPNPPDRLRRSSRRSSRKKEWRLEGIIEEITSILELPSSPQRLYRSLGVLGKAIEVDRVCLWKRSACILEGKAIVRLQHEWTNRGIAKRSATPSTRYRSLLPQGEMPESKGIASGYVYPFSPAEGQSTPSTQTRAFVTIPIEVRGECWGFVSVEARRSISTLATVPIDCLWSGGEMSILKAVATSIGSAIACQQAEEELLRLKDQIDLRVEERTIELTSDLKQLSYNVYHDFLTGLPNRTLLMEELERSIDRVRENPAESFAILLVDLERFKVINDSLGHSSGDRLLVEVAHRLQECVRPEDIVARLGGDEFAIVLKEIDRLSEATSVAERITTHFTRPFYINDRTVFTNVSIGIAMSSPEYNYPEEVLRDADIVIDRAKVRGQSSFAVFDTAMHDGFTEKLRLENELRQAVAELDRESDSCPFHVVYQPIVSLATDCIVGFEALLRWDHPELGSISPVQFIPIAEETGLIVQMGEWILFQACRQLRIWEDRKQSQIPLKMSVNISGRQFSQTDLISQIDRILELTGVRGRNLKLEVTESAIMDNADSATKMLLELKERQIQLCMDDFGTGYSSLSYLHRFPLDTLKIDRSFVSPITSFRDKSEIVQTIVTLAHNLGMSVVAEGVETPIQQKTLRSLGCEFAQGYLFSKPVDSHSASRLISV